MTGDVKDSLEIHSNKKPYHWALRILFLFMIPFCSFGLILLIYEFGFDPEDQFGWGIWFPIIIVGSKHPLSQVRAAINSVVGTLSISNNLKYRETYPLK